jgi:hypothetical protein
MDIQSIAGVATSASIPDFALLRTAIRDVLHLMDVVILLNGYFRRNGLSINRRWLEAELVHGLYGILVHFQSGLVLTCWKLLCTGVGDSDILRHSFFVNDEFDHRRAFNTVGARFVRVLGIYRMAQFGCDSILDIVAVLESS